MKITYLASWSVAILLSSLGAGLAADSPKPLRALMITGGCCHDYQNQKNILAEGISARANVEWTVVHEGGNSTRHKVSVYAQPDWAKGYDVVVHNECFADEKEPEWAESILKPHREGVPALVIHCAMHSYRTGTDAWFDFLGVKSHRHGSHFAYKLTNQKPEHPIMQGFPENWMTPREELYNIAAVGENTISLGTGFSPETKKEEVAIWVNTYGKGRVFGTTVGHYNHTMEHPVYLDYVTRGLLWACDKLEETGEPKTGYGPKAKE